jgi:nucleotide-binding universal stress UspA family protein
MTTTQFPRVLVALDRIEDAQATVSTLRATQPGRQDLVLLLVLPDDSTVHDIQDALQRLSLEAVRLGRFPCAVQTDLRLGLRVTQIVNAARDHEVDVIAMVHHPRSLLRRWLVRADTDDVVRQAPVPMLFLAQPVAGLAHRRPDEAWSETSAGDVGHGGRR